MSRSILPPPAQRTRPDVSLAIVNIVLLLILFFLATGAMMNAPAGEVPVPETLDLPIEQLPAPVLIAQGPTLMLDGAPVAPDLLVQALAGIEGIDDLTVHVVIAADAPAQALIDLIAQPGMERFDIALVTVHRRSETGAATGAATGPAAGGAP